MLQVCYFHRGNKSIYRESKLVHLNKIFIELIHFTFDVNNVRNNENKQQ